MRLVFPSQGAPELFPAFRGLLNQLNKSRDSSSHTAPQSFRSGRKQRSIFLAGKGKLAVGTGFHFHNVLRLVAKPLKEIASLGLERCGVGKNGNRKVERREVTFAVDNHAGGKMNWSESFKLVGCTLPDSYEDEAREICQKGA